MVPNLPLLINYPKTFVSSVEMTEKITLTEENTKVVQKPVIYNGQTQKIPIWIIYGRDTVLRKGVDYELDSELEGKWAAEYQVTLHGIGDYAGSFLVKGVILLPESPLVTESVYCASLFTEGNRDRLPYPSYSDLVEEYERKHSPQKSPRVTVSVFTHKSELYQSQDATWPESSCTLEMNDEVFRAVLATGAVHSYKAQQYAAALARKYAEHGADIFYEPNLQYQVSMGWCDSALAECSGDQKKWDEELRILERRVASSTITGLELFRNSRTFKIDAVGNSVIFILTLKDDWEISSYVPKLNPADFKDVPYMIHSHENIMIPDEEIQCHFSIYAADYAYSPDKAFILTSAPLAKFILTPDKHYSRQEKLNDLITISSPEEFDTFCAEQQKAGRMDDGQITMMIVNAE